jgi:hypothetical protein
MKLSDFRWLTAAAFFAANCIFSGHACAAQWLEIADLPGVRVATAAERAGFAKQFGGAQIAYNFEDAKTRVLVHEGNLTVDGNLSCGDIVVVTGDLTISGNYHDYQNGTGVLLVTGAMQMDNLYSWGALYVGKNLNAKGLVLTVYNDFTFEVKGKVNARALVVSDKSGDYQLGNTLAEISDNAEPVQRAMAMRILLPEFFTNLDVLEREAGDALSTADFSFDDAMAEKRIRGNEALFRAQIAPAHLLAEADQALADDMPVKTLLELLTHDRLIAQLVASNPDLDPALYAPLLALNDEIVNEWIATSAPGAALPILTSATLTPAVAKRLIASGEPSAAIVSRLATSKNPAVRAVLAGGIELSAELANSLANDQNARVRLQAVRTQRYQLSPDTIAKRLLDDDALVLEKIALIPLSFAQAKALLPKLNGDGLLNLADTIAQTANGAEPNLMSASQTQEIAELLLKNTQLSDASNAFLAQPEAQQALTFDALMHAGRIQLDHVAEQTHSADVMQKIVDLAFKKKQAIPQDLAKNPRLSLRLQQLIFAQARDAARKADDDYGDHPMDTLAELLNQDSMDAALVDDCVALAISRNEITQGAGGIYEALLGRQLSAANLSQLDEKLSGTEDWSLVLLRQRKATPTQLRVALPRWYEDDAALAKQLNALRALEGAAFFYGLSAAKSAELREVAAGHSNTPAASLVALAKDAIDDVAHAARTNPNLPRAQRFAAASALKGGEVAYLSAFKLTPQELRAMLPTLAAGAVRREAQKLLAR